MPSQGFEIHKISIMRKCDRAEIGLSEYRLGIRYMRISGGTVSDMADGTVTRSALYSFVQKIPDKAVTFVCLKIPVIVYRNAGGFLPSMLQREKREVHFIK